MRVRTSGLRMWTLIPICLVAAGCASTGAPDNWLPPAETAPLDPYGAWMTVELLEKKDGKSYLAGEFLAIGRDSLYIIPGYSAEPGPIVAISLSGVKKATIAHFDPETGKASGWVLAGSLSTLSHGIGAGLTMPLWIIIGSSMAGSHSRTPLENYPDLTWDGLRMYARFPQGPPPGLHQLGLKPKPR